MTALKQLTTLNINIMWMADYGSLAGNETADSLARKGRESVSYGLKLNGDVLKGYRRQNTGRTLGPCTLKYHGEVTK